MRVSQIVRAARHYGSRAYDYARVAGGQLNNIVETSAHVYGGLVQPLLKHHGVDTGAADHALSDLYSHYNAARTSANYFDSLIKT